MVVDRGGLDERLNKSLAIVLLEVGVKGRGIVFTLVSLSVYNLN